MKVRFLVVAGFAVGSAMACGSADREGYADPAAAPGAGGDGAAGGASIVAPADGGKSGDGGAKKDSGKDKGDAASASDAGPSVTDGAASVDASSSDSAPADGGVVTVDASTPDVSLPDASVTPTGPITGGPCISGASGATAYRIKWINAGGKAQVSYEVNGLPDQSRWKAGAYGYQIGFSASYVDPFLASGGLQLDGSDFVDIELSTVGLSVIRSVTLSLFGRSYNTTASGSFNWQTFEGTGSTPSGAVSNVAPYAWTSADATTEFSPGNGSVLLRIKAGPPSGAMVVSRIELCIDAD